MERLVYLDTHVVVWLFAGDRSLFPERVLDLLSQRPITISPIVLLELQYLFEVGRIKVGPEKIFRNLEDSVGLTLCHLDFKRITMEAIKQGWTRDPFDRVLVAHASLAKATLISKDNTILKHYSRAIWGG